MDLSESGATGLSQHKQAGVDGGAPVLTLLGLAVSMGASTLIAPAGAEAASSPAAKIQSATITHIVREGETLWSLAERYSVTPKSIALANDVNADSLRVGQRLDIAAAGANAVENQVPAAMPVAPVANTAAERDAVVPRNLAQIQVEQAVPAGASSGSVVPVATASDGHRSEANLLAASQFTKTIVPGAELKLVPANGADVKPSSLSPLASDESVADGEFVAQVPTPLAQPSAAPRTEAEAEQPAEYSVATSSLSSLQRNGGLVETTTYRIRVGDTVSSIARAHGISSAELIRLNGIRNPNRVFAGQALTVPVSGPQQTLADIIESPSQPVRVAAAAPTRLPEVADTSELQATQAISEPQIAPAISEQPAPPTSIENEAADDAVAVAPAEVEPTAPALPSPSSVEPPVKSELVRNEPVENEPAVAPQVAARPDSALEPEVDTANQNAYAQALRDDIAVMAQVDDDVVTPDAQPTSAASETALALASDVVDDVVDPSAVNPEFEAAASDIEAAEADDVDQPSEVVVARAPLGSENYQDLAEPVTGRMVSPQLPPLSDDPSDHLPSATSPMDGYLWPARGLLTSGYGWRWGRMHQGIDVAAPVGTPIVAAAPGVVEFSGWNSGGYGNMVDIRHPDGNKTRYAHNSRNLVRVGQKVQQGQQIAEMGSTGYSTGPHLHFEIHVPRQGAVNPVAMLPGR